MKTVVILQSSYIPWKGYFDLIARCDEFVFYDDTQFTRRDWRSRNQIKTAQGVQWLTIPVETKGKYTQLINQTRISDRSWAERHWDSIRHAYRRAAHFESQHAWLQALYESVARHDLLSEVNIELTTAIARRLGIATAFTRSEAYPGQARKTERLIEICRAAAAEQYLSGPSARAYLDVDAFRAAGIALKFMSYEGYPAYQQLHGPFVHEVSIVDPILNLGDAAVRAMERPRPAIADADIASAPGLN